MSPGVTTPTNSNSSKKQNASKIETSINNEDVDSIIESNDDFSKNSQKSTPSRKKDSNLSTRYDKDRASVISVSSAKKNNIQKNSSPNSDKKDFDQLFESIDNDNSELNSEITTPVKPASSEKSGKSSSIRTSSSAKKVQLFKKWYIISAESNYIKVTIFRK